MQNHLLVANNYESQNTKRNNEIRNKEKSDITEEEQIIMKMIDGTTDVSLMVILGIVYKIFAI